MSNTTHLEAKLYIHQNLSSMLDLRKTSLVEVQSEHFREKTRMTIQKKLAESARFSFLSQNQELIREILDETLGLGPLEPLIKSEEISEIMVNGPDQIFVEKNGVIETTPLRFSNETCLRNMINRIISPLGRRVDESSPMVDARLPDGSRFNAILPPLSLKGPIVTIRKFSNTIMSASDLIDRGSMTVACAFFLHLCIQLKKNILIAGGTGTGKTTLLNVLSMFIPKHERIITIEDSAELKLHQPHVISLECRPENVEGKGEVSIRDLLKNALRMRPDRIIVGECRGNEALDMLQAMNTGHEGSMTTIHANSSRDALLRLETLTMMSGYDWPLSAIRQQIQSALDIVVFIKRDRRGRRGIEQVTEICGLDQGVTLTQDLFRKSHEDASLEFSKNVPRFFKDIAEKDRSAWMKKLTSSTAC